MKKYYINVWISVYANSSKEANTEVRECLNTGRGHIHEYEISQVSEHRCSCSGFLHDPDCLEHGDA